MTTKYFDLTNRICLITGGAGMLGVKHAEAIADMGGIPILLDLAISQPEAKALEIAKQYKVGAIGLAVDITNKNELLAVLDKIINQFGAVDVLINNAANNPKVESNIAKKCWSRFENFPLEQWNQDILVGLTGAFLVSQVVGAHMAQRQKGVILNIASDLALIAPDQRIYRQPGLAEDEQPVKPVTYSVVKSGLLGLTRYLATYWAEKNVRVNAICPGGVMNNQDTEFVQKLTNLIPMGRMARPDEYKAAIIFLVSDASSYMTGACLTIDGGRTTW